MHSRKTRGGVTVERLRVGVIGTGWGRVHIQGFQADPRSVVTAVSSTDAARAEQVGRTYGVARAYGGHRDLLADPSVDAVAVITNPATHAEITLAALEAGKHVLCAKPLALTLADARAMLERARKSGRVHAIDLPMRFSAVHGQVRDLLVGGTLGRPVSLTVSTVWSLPSYFAGSYHKIDELVHARRKALSLPSASANKAAWFGSRVEGGGLFFASVPRIVDRLTWIFGPVRSVSARVHTAQPEVRTAQGDVYRCDAYDSCHAVLEFASGLTALVQASPLGWNGHLARLEVHCTEGSFLEDVFSSNGVPMTRRMTARTDGSAYVEMTPPPEDTGEAASSGVPAINAALIRRFVAAILDGTPMVPSFADGYRIQQVISAMIAASETGARQEIDPSEASGG